MKKKEISSYTTISITGETFCLEIFVTDKLKYEDGQGLITLNRTDAAFVGDNLDWFLDITPEKKNEIKKDLEKEGAYKKGVIKELKVLIKRAIKLGVLKKARK